MKDDVGGLFSVALSLGSLPVGVTHLRCPVEAGLSSRGSAKSRRDSARTARGRLARCSTRLLQQPIGSLREQNRCVDSIPRLAGKDDNKQRTQTKLESRAFFHGALYVSLLVHRAVCQAVGDLVHFPRDVVDKIRAELLEHFLRFPVKRLEVRGLDAVPAFDLPD